MHQGDEDEETAPSPPVQRPPPSAEPAPIVLSTPPFPASSARRAGQEKLPTPVSCPATTYSGGDVEARLLDLNYIPSDGSRRSQRGGCLRSVRERLLPLVNASWFGNLSTGLVLLNMVVMCMPYTGQPDSYGDMLEQATHAPRARVDA